MDDSCYPSLFSVDEENLQASRPWKEAMKEVCAPILAPADSMGAAAGRDPQPITPGCKRNLFS